MIFSIAALAKVVFPNVDIWNLESKIYKFNCIIFMMRVLLKHERLRKKINIKDKGMCMQRFGSQYH